MPIPWFVSKKPIPRTSIMLIRPYKQGQTWLFDDAGLGIYREAFVAGMSEIMDWVVEDAQIEGAQLGFNCFFSAVRFPTAQGLLNLCEDQSECPKGSAWYQLNGTKMRGWLCPCLCNYFQKPPDHIYFEAREL